MMKRLTRALPVIALSLLGACGESSDVPSRRARDLASYALVTYAGAVVATTAELVAFRTVSQPGLDNAENPDFKAMTDYLEAKANELGLDFADHGNVVVVGLGASPQRLGVITHGDVQPADPSKWARNPFSLDSVSEPGLLVGRGVEDDKGPIATALYAMKAVKDQGLELGRRVELIISYSEESDWTPFRAFLDANPPPDLNVAIDAEYPVVVAEKSWNAVFLVVPPLGGTPPGGNNRLTALRGGSFLSQVPEDAEAVVASPTPGLEARLREAAAADSAVRYEFVSGEGRLTVKARGVSAHSSKPEQGRNAIAHLAALLDSFEWPDGQASRMLRAINDLVGTGVYGERFGSVATTHPFMGPLTLALTTLGLEGDTLVAGINIRSPAGRSPEALERVIREAVGDWKGRTGIDALEVRVTTSEPYYLEDAPHIPILLDIFAHYTDIPRPQPISMGGGTHARLVPNGVNFGPAMPGEVYTGHSEHEFIAREQLELNLAMYTAMLVELAGRGRPVP